MMEESVLVSWLDRYSPPIRASFRQRANKFVMRISFYADVLFEDLCPLGFRRAGEQQDRLDKDVLAIKHNILLSLLASLTCLSEGLFLQSGAAIRCCIEDALVLLDISENPKQLNLYLAGRYSAAGVLTRVKHSVPQEFLHWYGHYSANFAHFGPFHSAPYMPRACFPDNYVIGSGLENILLATYAFHVVLERSHFEQLPASAFWKRTGEGQLCFQSENRFADYVHRLQAEIEAEFNPDDRRGGFMYSQKGYRAK